MKRFILAVMALFIPFLSHAEIFSTTPKACQEGLYKAPMGPFSALVFCDDSEGSEIVVLHRSGFNSEAEKASWSLENRFWQELGEWSLEPTQFSFLEKGRQMVVATGTVFGTGKVYFLDLNTRRFTVLYDYDSGGGDVHSCEAVTLTEVRSGVVRMRVPPCGTRQVEKSMVLKIPNNYRGPNE